MSSSKLHPAALLGLFLAGLAALRCVFLPGNTPLGRLLIPLALLAIGALGLWLLGQSGCDRDTLTALLLPMGLALLLRALLLPHATLDYQDFLSKWVEHFRQNGGILALKDPVGNYNVPYLYLLALLSYLPSSLAICKLCSTLKSDPFPTSTASSSSPSSLTCCWPGGATAWPAPWTAKAGRPS